MSNGVNNICEKCLCAGFNFNCALLVIHILLLLSNDIYVK